MVKHQVLPSGKAAWKASSWKKYQPVMYALVWGAGKYFIGAFCDGDTHDIDTWDKWNGIHIEQQWKNFTKFSVLDGVEMPKPCSEIM